MNPAILTLFFVLLIIQVSYADSVVIHKKSRPEKGLTEIERKTRTQTALKKTKKDVPPEKVPEKKKVDAAPEKKAEYVYNPRGKTDPFVPFINAPETKLTKYMTPVQEKAGALLNKLQEPKTELQTVELAQLHLTAVIKSEDKTWAMVGRPKGRGYMLKKGTYIGTRGGVVDRVVCEDKMTPFGVVPVRKVIIKEPYVNSEGNPAYKLIEKRIEDTKFE